MTRSEWLRVLEKQIRKHSERPPTQQGNEAFYEAALALVATMYAATHRIGSGSIEELANAAYHAMQDKAEEILTRN